ncbi:hypothetical protein V6N13_061208 [Hibiscus sabdariffa]
MHGLPEWTQVSIFYNSVNTPTRMMLDASANGTLLDKPPREGLELEKLALNDYQHSTTRRGTMRRGTAQLDSSNAILAEISNLTNIVKNMQNQPTIQEHKAVYLFCEICGNNYDTSESYMARTNQFIQKTDSFIDRIEMRMQNQEADLKSLENQVGQISQVLKSRPIEDFLAILRLLSEGIAANAKLRQIPQGYGSRKTKIGEFETTAATEACLAMMHNKVPTKKTDPGSFTIPCSIGNNYTCKALCDPGASINLMPKSVFQKLGIGEAKPTIVMLQLAGRSYVQPERKIEDNLVRVDKFILLE